MNTTIRHQSLLSMARAALDSAHRAWLSASATYLNNPTPANSDALTNAQSAYEAVAKDHEQVQMMFKHMHGKQS